MSAIDRAFRPAGYWDSDDHILIDAIRPSWLDREYLPDCLPGEVEIARIVLESVTQDVVSIRARRRGSERRIVYRVVDEFESEFDFAPRSSRQPLSCGELVRLIDSLRRVANAVEGSGYTDEPWGFSAATGVEQRTRFVTVASRFYPTIGEHFRAS